MNSRLATLDYISPADRSTLDIKSFSKDNNQRETVKKTDDFYTVCSEAKKYVYDVYDQKIDERSAGTTKENYVEIYHNAMLGIPSAVNHIKKIIEDFVIDQNFRNVNYPLPYSSLINGIFEEEFGWGALSAFKDEADVEGAQLIGTDISFKRGDGHEIQPFKLRNIEQSFELTKRFANMHSNTMLDEYTKPELETRTHDNIRVSIMIPKRTHEEPVITLRRKTITKYNFEKMAELGAIPKVAIPLFEALAKLKVNSIIAGPPGCGKSTMLHAFMNAFLYVDKNGKRIAEPVKTVYAEGYPEWDARKIHPNTNLFHVLGSGKEFEDSVSAALLRHDITRIILAEIREHEVGLYRRASVQGIKQLMGTLHDLDPVDVPEILTNLYLQYFPTDVDYNTLYHTFSSNIHFSVSMDEFISEDDQFEKRVTGVHIYEPSKTGKVELYTIMDYDWIEKRWRYNDKIPLRFERMASKYNRKAYLDLKHHLNVLSASSKVPQYS